MIHVEMFQNMGRGVVASQDIPKGMIIAECEILVLSEIDTPIVNSTDLQWYTFVYSKTQDCLVLGLGEIFNHSDTPQVQYQIESINGREKMVFRSTLEIQKGSQIFISYNQDCLIVDASNYLINLIGA